MLPWGSFFWAISLTFASFIASLLSFFFCLGGSFVGLFVFLFFLFIIFFFFFSFFLFTVLFTSVPKRYIFT